MSNKQYVYDKQVWKSMKLIKKKTTVNNNRKIPERKIVDCFLFIPVTNDSLDRQHVIWIKIIAQILPQIRLNMKKCAILSTLNVVSISLVCSYIV